MGYITNFKNGCVSKCFVDRIPPNCHYMFSARFLAKSHLTRWLDGLTPTGLPVTDFPMGEGSTGRVPMIFLAEAQQPPIKADRWKHKTTNMSNTNLRPEIGEVSKHSLRCTMMYIHIVLHGCARLHMRMEKCSSASTGSPFFGQTHARSLTPYNVRYDFFAELYFHSSSKKENPWAQQFV